MAMAKGKGKGMVGYNADGMGWDEHIDMIFWISN